MSPLLRTATALTFVAALALTSGASCSVSSPDPNTTGQAQGPTGDRPPAGDPATARQHLGALKVAAWRSMTGYTRDKFPHWSAQGSGCDTRETVLKRDGKDVKVADGCKVTSGTWYSIYDKKSFTDPGELDVDHMVPLAAGWRSGAAEWDDAKRKEFANDLTRPQLIAVSASSNRAKGDQDPSQWKPANRDFWCEYAQDWIEVKYYWQLTVTNEEKTALTDMLKTCG